MGLPHSGFESGDIELVRIETKSLSLIIKGKPFHDKYESFKQYKDMDYHEAMHFQATGNEIESIQVFDVKGSSLLEPNDPLPIFFENGIYQLIISPKENTELSFYHEHPALRRAIKRLEIGSSYILTGNLQFRNEVGLSTLEVLSGNENIFSLTLEIFPSKLDYKSDYKKLLNEVNDEIYNLAFHFLKKTFLGAKINLDGKPSMTEFFRLIQFHFDSFVQAVGQIERQPHHQLAISHQRLRGDQLKRLDSVGRNYLRKRPNLFIQVDKGIVVNGIQVMPTHGLQVKKELTYDTYENRYVKWMIGRLTEKLQDLLDLLTAKSRWPNYETDLDLLARINMMKSLLDKKLKNSFWKQINRLDRSVMSLVLQMAPGYRDAFQIYLTVSKGLSLQSNIYRMSVKDVATLYEYWTYLKLGQLLNKKYKLVSQDIVKVNRDGLFVNLNASNSAKRVFKHPQTNEEIVLRYQKPMHNLPTVSQVPDTMLSIEKKGKSYAYQYIFDAKYRIDFAIDNSSYSNSYKSPGPLEEDINTMHRYRDSIVVRQGGPYERTAFGAYILFPWSDENTYRNHHFYKSISEVNIGGLPFLPNSTDLVEQFIEHLIEKSPEEIRKEGILPKGTLNEWQSSLEEKVLVGVISSAEQLQDCFVNGSFSIQHDLLKKEWQEIKYVALYVSKGSAQDKFGVVCYGRLDRIDFKNGFVYLHVNAWKDLSQPIVPVNYGIAGYMMTTYELLMNSKELPELYMKSMLEKTIWTTLRRVSDEVSIELNSVDLDMATEIKTYRFKNVIIRLDGANQLIQIDSKGIPQTVSYDELGANPSAVFKKVLLALDS